jgi:hypothetical protein
MKIKINYDNHKLTIKEVNLINYINMTSNEKLIKATKQLIDTNPNMLLQDFLIKILTDFDRGCINFSKFYIKLYDDYALLKSTFYNIKDNSIKLYKVYGLSI